MCDFVTWSVHKHGFQTEGWLKWSEMEIFFNGRKKNVPYTQKRSQ